MSNLIKNNLDADARTWKLNIEPVTFNYTKEIDLKITSKLVIISLIEQVICSLLFMYNLSENYIYWYIYITIITIRRLYTATAIRDLFEPKPSEIYKRIIWLTIIQIIIIIVVLTFVSSIQSIEIASLLCLIINTVLSFNCYLLTLRFELERTTELSSNPWSIYVPSGLDNSQVAGGSDRYIDINETQSIVMLYPDRISLSNPDDIIYSQNSQNAIVNEVVLPSGIKIPVSREGKDWRVSGTEIVLQ
jgi:hypothetical protein